MRTTKPLSSVSYNSREYLESVFNDLLKRKVISFWAYIWHKAEAYEKKDHIHMYMVPDELVDTHQLSPLFDELKDDGSIDAIKDLRTSNWGDWFYYGIHDPAYLACKYSNDMPKKYYYRKEDVIVSDPDIAVMYHERVDLTVLLSPSLGVIRDHALAGVTIQEFLRAFPVKKSDVRYVKEIYDLYGGLIK